MGTAGLAIVRRDGQGSVTVRKPDDGLQNVVRAMPEAILGHRVVVCEGQTEEGIGRGLVKHWDGQENAPLATIGTVLVPGGGDEAPKRAVALHELGYEAVYWGDGDKRTNPSSGELEGAGIATVIWADNMNTEQRLMTDASESLLQDLWSIAVDERDAESVSNQLSAALGLHGRPPENWEGWSSDHSLAELRPALGQAAGTGGWFKNVTAGERVGEALARALPDLSGTDLGEKLEKLRSLAYRD